MIKGLKRIVSLILCCGMMISPVFGVNYKSEYIDSQKERIEESGIIKEFNVIWEDFDKNEDYTERDYIGFYSSLLMMPEYVVDSFIMSGWEFHISDVELGKIDRFREYGSGVVGLSDFDKEEIWVYKGDWMFNKQTVIHEMGHFVELCMVGDGISDEDFIRERNELIEIIRKYAGSSRNEAYAEIWYEICKYDGNLDRSGLRELMEGCKGCFWEVYEDWLRFERFDSEGIKVNGT